MLCCCSATVFLPIDQVLAGSPQLRMFLYPGQLEPSSLTQEGTKVIDAEGDPTLELLIDDMGGHGRALESLKEELEKVPKHTTLSQYGFSTLANNVRTRLMEKYPDWGEQSWNYKEALALCLAGVPVKKEDVVVHNYSTEDGKSLSLTVDSLLSLGLFQLTEGRLQCAYVWIWALSKLSGDTDLAGISLDDYTAIEKQNNDKAPLGAQCWQHWEEFNTNFRMLKSSVLKDRTSKITDFHTGATFDVDSTKKPPSFTVRKLTVQRASKQYKTASGNDDIIICDQGEFRVSEADSIFLNGAGAPAGDAFLGLKGSSELSREVHHYKLLQKKVTSDLIAEEHEKSAGDRDLFLLFSVQDSEVSSKDLEPYSPCGLVDRRGFKQYYGPFAGRAFYAGSVKPDINEAGRFHLEAVAGVGKAYAKVILDKRPFDDLDDAVKKTKVPRTTLSRFRFAGKKEHH